MSSSIQKPTNSLNPSHRIPPKILTSIFDHLWRPGEGNERTGFFTNVPMRQSNAIVILTHVCRYWRATILPNPKFWTSVDFTHSIKAASWLERSGSMPIIADFITPNLATPVPTKKMLLQHSSRIRRVHISAPHKQLMEFLSNLRGHSPILEAMEIQTGFIFVGGFCDILTWTTTFKLPPMLKDAPSLKSLRLFRVEFSDCFLDLHHLTHLELSNSSAWPRNHLLLFQPIQCSRL